MAGTTRLRPIARLALAASLAIASIGGLAASPDASVSALSRWTGGIDLYRDGVFTTQKSWLWCTAADVQIIRNIVDRQKDHAKANQQRYFDYMRAHNRYDIPEKDGVDPAGWTAGLRHYVDSRYTLYASKSFDAALRSAVTNLRNTNLPVGITVAHGGHAWILTGFEATADPAVTARFKVTSVRVVGPLWGLQSRTTGYDMRPDTKLTPAQLKGYFTPWHYAGIKMAWEGRWVSVQPVAKKAAPAPKPAATPVPTPRPTAVPTPTPTLSPPLAAILEPLPAPTPTAGAVARLDASTPSAAPEAGSTSRQPGQGLNLALVAGQAAGFSLLIVLAVAILGTIAARVRRPS